MSTPHNGQASWADVPWLTDQNISPWTWTSAKCASIWQKKSKGGLIGGFSNLECLWEASPTPMFVGRLRRRNPRRFLAFSRHPVGASLSEGCLPSRTSRDGQQAATVTAFKTPAARRTTRCGRNSAEIEALKRLLGARHEVCISPPHRWSAWRGCSQSLRASKVNSEVPF